MSHMGGRDTPVSDLEEDIEDVYGGLSPIDGPSKSPFSNSPATGSSLATSTPLGSLTQSQSPAALGSVLSALSQAGRKQQGRRIMRGMTAEEQSKQRKVERSMDEARSVAYRDLRHYEVQGEEQGVGRIGTVLRKVKTEWGFVADDDFNPVALSLSLLDESSLGANRNEFESTKQLIAQALQGTVDDHYESFATAITLHNSVLASLTGVQSSVCSSRRRLRDSREALGSKRADLVQLWHRQQSIKEALRLLNTVDQLKNVPDRLESLMSEKHFLSAVNLLMRALKVIHKPEMTEIGATSDLRTYLRSQESHMLEILVDEIHNHLYLKSPHCDRRWRGYVPGEQQLPDVKWGSEYEVEQETSTTVEEGSYDQPILSRAQLSQQTTPTKLAKYLESLSTRRVLDPTSMANDLTDLEGGGLGYESQAHPASMGTPSASQSRRASQTELANGDAAQAPIEDEALATAERDENPESDSFLYLEMLLEALARLGKMSVALEVIHQRLPVEIHTLVESTIREVEARTEPLRRSSIAVRPESILLASSSALARAFGAEGGRGSLQPSHTGRDRPMSTLLKLSATESSQVESEGEVMRDLFWTLFSKLDAVLQGHRVVHEVASRISQRSGFKETGQGTTSIAEKLRGRLVGGEKLLGVWRPIQTEVRTLLHEYLMDDSNSPTSRRNNMTSINEVLRQGHFNRDRSKKLFQLAGPAKAGASTGAIAGRERSDTVSSAQLAKRDLTVIKRHEDALNGALRAFVPGLVNAAEGPSGGSTLGVSSLSTSLATRQREQAILSSTTIMGQDTSSVAASLTAGNHRLLVKADAFNISVLFQPALAFVERVRVIMPQEAAGETSTGFSSFLEEFVQDVFLPQLEDKVQSLFQGAAGGPDAFQEDSASRSASTKPVVKSSTNVLVLVDSLYSMLCTTPFHRESYSRLIIQVIVHYYTRCHERYQNLVTADPPVNDHGPLNGRDTSKATALTMLSAEWAQDTQLSTLLAEAIDPTTTLPRRQELQEEEEHLQIQLAQCNGANETVGMEDIITSRKKLLSLCHLEHSLQWFLRHISRLKATDEALPVSAQPAARLSVLDGVEPLAEHRELKLPLSADMAARYDTLPRTYRHLSNTVLFTLRMELRARVIHHLDLAVTEGNYLVEESAAEPDPHVVDLNADLANLDDIMADSLTPEDHRFVFDGLASLMDTLLIASVKKVRAVNLAGVSKMIRNILALQQNLKNIVISDSGGFSLATVNGRTTNGSSPSIPSVSFEQSRHFWDLLSRSPEDMLEQIKKDVAANTGDETNHRQKYGFEEVKSALNLMLGLDNTGSSGNKSATTATTPASATSTGSTDSKMASMNGSAGAASTAMAPAVGPSLPSLKAGTMNGLMKEGVSRQKLNEYLIDLQMSGL